MRQWAHDVAVTPLHRDESRMFVVDRPFAAVPVFRWYAGRRRATPLKLSSGRRSLGGGLVGIHPLGLRSSDSAAARCSDCQRRPSSAVR